MTKFREVLISFIKSFLSGFITVFVPALIMIPNEVLANPDAWKTGIVGGLIMGIVRSSISEAWKKTLPVALGGEKKS